jgi:hypothetical protein
MPGGDHAKPSGGRKVRAIPGAPGCPIQYEPARTIKKVGKTLIKEILTDAGMQTVLTGVRIPRMKRDYGEAGAILSPRAP